MREIKKMTIKELDNFIDELPYSWMKALRYQRIKEIRPDYIPKHLRKCKCSNIVVKL